MRTRRHLRGLAPLIAASVLVGVGMAAAAPASAAISCRVDYSIANSWPGGFQGGLTLVNTGDALSSWTVGFSFATAEQKVTQSWNGMYKQSGTAVTFTNAPWSASLPTGGTANVGFIGEYGATNPVPTQFSVNGVACGSTVPTPPTPTPTPTPTPPGPTPTPPVPTPTPTSTATNPTGPYSWHNAEIVGGGFVTGLIFNPSEKNLLYARTDMGGAYRWNSSTSRWLPLTDWAGDADWNLLGIESIATDPVDPARVYLAAGTYTQSWAGNAAILRSTDRGATFARTDLPFKLGANEDGRSIGERLAIDPNKNGTLYLGSRLDGLWRSTDFGVTWAKVASFPVTSTSSGVGIGFVTFDKSTGSAGKGSATIYVGVEDAGTSLYRSTDGGSTWSAVAGQPTGQLPHHGVLASNGQLYVTYGNGPGPNGMTAGSVWKLTTSSGAWTNITPTSGSYGYAGLSVDATNPSAVVVSTLDRWWPNDEIYRSTNGGSSWTALSTNASYDNSAAPWTGAGMGHWMGALAIDPFAPGHVLFGTGDGIRGSDDLTAADSGGTTHWSVRAQGLEQTAVLALVAPPGGASVLSALGDISGFRHDDLTRVGTHMTSPDWGNTTGIDFAEATATFVARASGGAPYGTYSTDGGTSWTAFSSVPPGAQGGTVAVSADATTVVWTPSGLSAFVSHDRGASWTATSGLPTDAQVIADRSSASTFYALSGGNLYISTDRGGSFSVRTTGLPNGTLKAVAGRAGDLWIAAWESGLRHSTNGGTSFTTVGGGVTWAAGVGFGKAANGQTYPAIYLNATVNGVTGIYRSVDGGSGWTRINDDQHQFGWLGSVITGDPDVFGRVYVGTNGRGVIYADPS